MQLWGNAVNAGGMSSLIDDYEAAQRKGFANANAFSALSNRYTRDFRDLEHGTGDQIRGIDEALIAVDRAQADEERQRQVGYQQQGLSRVGNALETFDPAAQLAWLFKDSTRRGDYLKDVTGPLGLDPEEVPMAASADPMTRRDLARRLAEVMGFARSQAEAGGKLGAWEGLDFENQKETLRSGQDINRFRNFAAGSAGTRGFESAEIDKARSGVLRAEDLARAVVNQGDQVVGSQLDQGSKASQAMLSAAMGNLRNPNAEMADILRGMGTIFTNKGFLS
jgi:hypothetical protein